MIYIAVDTLNITFTDKYFTTNTMRENIVLLVIHAVFSFKNRAETLNMILLLCLRNKTLQLSKTEKLLKKRHNVNKKFIHGNVFCLDFMRILYMNL